MKLEIEHTDITDSIRAADNQAENGGIRLEMSAASFLQK